VKFKTNVLSNKCTYQLVVSKTNILILLSYVTDTVNYKRKNKNVMINYQINLFVLCFAFIMRQF